MRGAQPLQFAHCSASYTLLSASNILTHSSTPEIPPTMFAVKKALEQLLEPLSLTLLLLLFAVLMRRRLPRLAFASVFLAMALLFTLSLPRVAWYLARGLETQYVPINPSSNSYSQVRTIVVLAGGYDPSSGFNPWDEMNVSTLRRTLEGVRLAGALPNTTLILSGGDPDQGTPAAPTMARFAATSGIPRKRILIEQHSRDTADEALMLAPQLGRAPFLLVTSAFHLQRSCALFKRAGATPLPAPTDFLSTELPPDDIAPTLVALDASQKVLHEYLGIIWGRLRDQL